MLFAKLDTVLRSFSSLVESVLALGIVFLGEDFIFTEDGFAKFTGDFGAGTCVSCHFCVCLKLSVSDSVAPAARDFRDSRDHREVKKIWSISLIACRLICLTSFTVQKPGRIFSVKSGTNVKLMDQNLLL